MQSENKVKVLLCSPYGTIVGGISKWTGHVLNYYNNTSTNTILKHYYPTSEKGVYQNSWLIVRLYVGITKYIPFLYGLRKELKSNEYDIVHLVSSASISLVRDIISLKIAQKRKVKTLMHFRFGRIPDLYKNPNWEQKLLHRVICLADKVIVIDKASYNTLAENGYTSIELLPNPLTPKVSEIINKNKGVERQERKLLFAGHNVITKGVIELVDACKVISNIQLKMIGYVTDEMKNQMITQAGENYEKWLEISGEQDFETTIKEMLSCSVFILPSYTEGFPNVIIESMACGCPIVTTCVGAIPEMLDIENGENNGLCVMPKDTEQLRVAIQRMLDDRGFAKRCGDNALKRVNKLYSMTIIWEQMELMWKDLIELK